MSFQAVTWAIEQKAGGPSAKAILWSIANYANEHLVAWPSQATIAADSEQSPDTVQRRLLTLVDRGLLRRVPLRFAGRKTIDFFVLPISPFFESSLEELEPLLPRGCSIDPSCTEESNEESGASAAADCGSAQPQTLPQPAAHAAAYVRQQEPVIEPKEPVERERAREGLSEEAKKRLALFRRRWPTTMLDPRDQVEREWSKLSDADQQKALDTIEPFLAAQKAHGRKHNIGAATYLNERRFDFIETAKAAPGGAIVTFNAWSREWWAYLLAKVDQGQPVSMLIERATTSGRREESARAHDIPPLDGFSSYPTDGEAWPVWRDWLSGRGVSLPVWRDRMWVHLPARSPPPDGQRIFETTGVSEQRV